MNFLFAWCQWIRITIVHNARVYEPLRCQSAILSSYHNLTKWIDLRKPATSNGLYTLLCAGIFISKYSPNYKAESHYG